jgi:hypothetical protein
MFQPGGSIVDQVFDCKIVSRRPPFKVFELVGVANEIDLQKIIELLKLVNKKLSMSRLN